LFEKVLAADRAFLVKQNNNLSCSLPNLRIGISNSQNKILRQLCSVFLKEFLILINKQQKKELSNFDSYIDML